MIFIGKCIDLMDEKCAISELLTLGKKGEMILLLKLYQLRYTTISKYCMDVSVRKMQLLALCNQPRSRDARNFSLKGNEQNDHF